MPHPIIDPSTLSEEQRETIRDKYNNREDIIREYETIDKASTLKIVTDLFEALFGSEFINRKEN
ncbi:MAG: hypothetical protein NC248_12300 [Bacteroides sp.]|nr:hypothetical protein [Bacteroides sp.]MCM1391109.1 hypothetical protein [Bacteroides sp.]